MTWVERASALSQEDYQARIDKGLDRAFADAAKNKNAEDVELTHLKAVIFSDLHRGARDKADDFARCERAYSAALGWYAEQGYDLWLLGDVEELWENSAGEVIRRYVDVMRLEQEFVDRGQELRRFYGNHDLEWSNARRVKEYLHDFNPGVKVIEALRLRVVEAGEPLGLLFLVHGHQGTLLSENLSFLSRIALRLVWRPVQRAQGYFTTTPAEDSDLREKHDVAMYEWAIRAGAERKERDRPVLIAGHTHHPVFPGKPPQRPTRADERRLEEKLEQAPPDEKPPIRAELELVSAILRENPYVPPYEIKRPCYFNSGCCCFPDRDVTCIELNGNENGKPPVHTDGDPRGKIRLMRWLDDEGKALPKELASMKLRGLFDQVAQA